MSTHSIQLLPGSLWGALTRAAQNALNSGALQPIHTRQLQVEDAGVRFLVRVVSSLKRKQRQKLQTNTSPKSTNPFLPYERDLFVANVSNTHVGLLNKFNVIHNHLLIVTRRFEHQELILNKDDFASLYVCMKEYPSLGFYNGGVTAGASQMHKHLQLIPLPLHENEYSVPSESLFSEVEINGLICTNCGFPFSHAITKIDLNNMRDLDANVDVLVDCYHALLDTIGISCINKDGLFYQSMPYNLLVTENWMMVVPRTQEYFQDISINALGFAGSLFVRDSGQLQKIVDTGPMNVLRSVSLFGK